MMSLNELLQKLYLPFAESTQLTCPVTHYKRLSSFPFMVWMEDSENNSFNADNLKLHQKLTGYIDYFTKAEFDPNVDIIQDILISEGVAWALSAVDYDDNLNLIHFRWRWEVV